MRRPEGARVHRDVGTAVRLSRDDGDTGNGRLGECVQQLRPAPYDAVPFLADAGQIPRHVDDHDQWKTEGVTHAHEPGRLLAAARVETTTQVQRVVGDDTDGAAAETANGRADARRPPRVQLDA